MHDCIIITACYTQYMKKFALSIICLSLSSCGLFLETSGVKNYNPEAKIDKKGLNDYQYDFIYLIQLLEEGFPKIDSIFPEEQRTQLKTEIIEKLSRDNTDERVSLYKPESTYQNSAINILRFICLSNLRRFTLTWRLSRQVNGTLFNISKEYDSLSVGKKITTINGINTEEVENRLLEYTFSENKVNQQNELSRLQLYNKSEFLLDAKIINQPSDQLKIGFEDGNSVALAPNTNGEGIEVYEVMQKLNSITRRQPHTYAYQTYSDQNFAYLQFNNMHDKVDILDGIESYVKPWLQPIARGYVKRQFKKEKPSKRIAQYYNPKNPIFAEFIEELVDSLNKNRIENLVIDLRYNSGGNLLLGKQLMYFLTDKKNLKDFTELAYTSKIYKSYFPSEYKRLESENSSMLPHHQLIPLNRNGEVFDEISDPNSIYHIRPGRPIFKGNIYVLANYGTGSAAALLTTLFQDNNVATVIGTSVGNNPTGLTTLTPMKLPKTKASVSISSSYSIRPIPSKGIYQVPQYEINYSINDMLQGIDPYLEKVFELIRKRN